jgi:hypothetical protein
VDQKASRFCSRFSGLSPAMIAELISGIPMFQSVRGCAIETFDFIYDSIFSVRICAPLVAANQR